MSNSEILYRLIIRFTNGETMRFVLREPIDTRQISDKTRFAVVRTFESGDDRDPHLFMANLTDVSFVKTERVESKELRQRVAGIASALALDADVTPQTPLSTVEFL